MADLTDDAVRRARVTAQLLHRPDRRPAVVDLVSRLLAVQAQDIGAAPLALRARSRDLTASDVEAARQDRSVVRMWGPRGTLHLIAAADLGWLTSLFSRPAVVQATRRLGQEGVRGTLPDLVRRTERALAGQGPLTKAQLGERLAASGVDAEGQGIVYLAFLAAARGLAVLGPDRGGKPTYVHAGDWLGRPVTPDRSPDEALAELARRYLRAHAPAGPEDLAAWCGLPLRDCRAGFAAIAGELTETVHNGCPLWSIRQPRRTPVVAVALVPAFDEYLLGWRDRSLTLDAGHAKAIAPGGGILRAGVVADGRFVGMWRVVRGAVVTDLFGEADPDAVRAETSDVARFLAP